MNSKSVKGGTAQDCDYYRSAPGRSVYVCCVVNKSQWVFMCYLVLRLHLHVHGNCGPLQLPNSKLIRGGSELELQNVAASAVTGRQSGKRGRRRGVLIFYSVAPPLLFSSSAVSPHSADAARQRRTGKGRC